MRFAAIVVIPLAGCATPPEALPDVADTTPKMRPAEARARIASLLPDKTSDRNGWATDIHAALTALRQPVDANNVCAVIGITEQESGFVADPPVAGLSAIAWRQIERRSESAGVPMTVVRAALQVESPDGKRYAERIDAVRTEGQLSRIYEDFIGTVPLGQQLFSGWNPVRTGGAMQVSIDFAERHVRARPYPYAVETSIRREMFTRRGGMYFGIAHLLDYPAKYTQAIHRFADFNAGHYASRNAALQNAISVVTGVPLALDGDLVRRGPDSAKTPGETEAAARTLGDRIDMSQSAIRRDLEKGDGPSLEGTRFAERVFALADQVEGKAVPRAVLPGIELQSPKITRKLTTAWFANRVEERYRRCMAKVPRVWPDGGAGAQRTAS